MGTGRVTTAAVRMWGRRIGAVTWDHERGFAYFQYEPDFVDSGIQVAPFHMPLSAQVYSFPALGTDSYHGLPGMLADCLPDRFGNALIEAWLRGQGRSPGSFDPVERLCYTGARGMGALEFEPALGDHPTGSAPLDVAALVGLANRVLADRSAFSTMWTDDDAGASAIRQILRVGTSAGGARAKALIAWNPKTGEVRSGQVDPPRGFGLWLLKFDGVHGNRDRELDDPLGFGRVEFAYSLMARAAGIEISECRLLEEGGRAHFATRRFDRDERGKKLHLQSLFGLQHLDFQLAGAHSYEQTVQTVRALRMPIDSVEEIVRRALFHIVARNQDDHTKNTAFLMDKQGRWRLAPAYDETYAWNPDGAWTRQHQMSFQGKRDDFRREDVVAFGKFASLRRGRAEELLEQVESSVRRWPEFAASAGVEQERVEQIARAHRSLE